MAGPIAFSRVLLALEHFRRDAWFGFRQMRRSPLTAAVTVGTLAIGIGMNTAVFSLVDAVLLRPVPYSDPARLAWIAPYSDVHRQQTWASRADYVIWRNEAQSFDGMLAYGTQDVAVGHGPEVTQERVASIGGDFWTITGAHPAAGRLFGEDEEGAIVLSYALFQRRFGGRPDAIGRTVEVSGFPFTVAGVLPPDFRFVFPHQVASGDEVRDVDAFIALPRGQEIPGRPIAPSARPSPGWVCVVGRLRAPASVEAAQAEMDVLHARLHREYPRPPALRRSIRVEPLADRLVQQARLSMLVLLGAVGFVLLIATANVANLVLAQTFARARETAVRVAVGAARSRLVMQFVAETGVLVVAGGALGVLVAFAALPGLVGLGSLAMPGISAAAVDGRVLLFTLVVSVGTGLFVTCAAVLETSRIGFPGVLSGTTMSGAGPGRRFDGLLIIAEVALALVLLAGAGLMIKSLAKLHTYPAGFSPESTYTMRVPLSGPRYEGHGQKLAYIEALTGRLANIPGVEAVGISASTYNMPVSLQGGPRDPDMPRTVAIRAVSPGYLRAMGVPLVRGRWPAPDETFDAVVVNETFARTMAPDGDPTGRTVEGSFVSAVVVGVVRDVPSSQLGAEPMPDVYYPYLRVPAFGSILVAVRMPASAIAAVREAAGSVDPTQPVYQFRPLEQAFEESIAPRRFSTLLLGVFAGSALAMALAGTFGVVARSVSRRTRECGIRIALGARPARIASLMATEALAYTLAGIGAGIAAALALGRVVGGMLHEVQPTDPMTMAGAAATLVVAGLVACSLPAFRAARIDPVVALREE
jgi:putative ABC transport system permease protein